MVHAGLQLLRDEMQQHNHLVSCLELLEDIYSASDGAISILNDLMSYENLDAGGCK